MRWLPMVTTQIKAWTTFLSGWTLQSAWRGWWGCVQKMTNRPGGNEESRSSMPPPVSDMPKFLPLILFKISDYPSNPLSDTMPRTCLPKPQCRPKNSKHRPAPISEQNIPAAVLVSRDSGRQMTYLSSTSIMKFVSGPDIKTRGELCLACFLKLRRLICCLVNATEPIKVEITTTTTIATIKTPISKCKEDAVNRCSPAVLVLAGT